MKFRTFNQNTIHKLPQVASLPKDQLLAMRAVASVFPFRVNFYVVEKLIDWSRVPDDPIYQLVFPQPGMLYPSDLAKMRELIVRGCSSEQLECAAREIQRELNPHPSDQLALNLPSWGGEPFQGIQHKYRQTVLFFPTQGQTCHSYCSYCFRWAQFIGDPDLRMANHEVERLSQYILAHQDVQSLLFTGGDPMIMSAKVLERYIEPLLKINHLKSIRFGTKSVAYWPYRFVTDSDSDDLLRLFERIQAAGKTVALMAHYTHSRELSTDIAQQAVRRIRNTGAVVRAQCPLIQHVNDDEDALADLWNTEVRLGIVPYYLFNHRDTGAMHYFGVPLARSLELFEAARENVSGLAHTVRGPVMSTSPGKILINGVAHIQNQHVFVLKFLQARDPSWTRQVFFAEYDRQARWMNELKPALGISFPFTGKHSSRPTEQRLSALVGGPS